jgi:hypothetical protein
MNKKILFDVSGFKQLKEFYTEEELKNPVVGKVWIQWEIDEYGFPDYLDYLVTQYNADTKTIIKSDQYSQNDVKTYGWNEVYKWIQQVKERIEEFNKGNIWMEYVKAYAQIAIFHPWSNSFRMLNIDSSGLYGIDSDSEENHKLEVENEQVADLLDILKAFHIDLTKVKIGSID